MVNNPDSNGIWIPSLAGGFFGTFDPSTNSSGEYVYVVTDCDISDSAFVNISLNNADAGEDSVLELCDTDEAINLFNEIPENPNQKWKLVASLAKWIFRFLLNQNLSGIYTAYNIVLNGCTDSSAIEVQISSVQPSPINYD